MQIEWATPALDDLRGIDKPLFSEVDLALALRIPATIRFRAKFLEDFPHGGRPHRDGQRILRVFDTTYLIRYRIVGDVVPVLRAHHEREDWFIEP